MHFARLTFSLLSTHITLALKAPRFQLPDWLTNKTFILCLWASLALFASIQSLLLPNKKYKESNWEYPSYNNYIIFKQSFHHLLDHKDLYKRYPAEHWDLYKYTPTFALLFGSMAVLPDAIGLTFWNLLNALVLAFAVYFLPYLTNKQKGLILLACAIELMTSMQNEQSNGLIAGLLIFAFGLSERKKFVWAIILITIATFIKPFGLVGFVLFLFYPNKIKHGVISFFSFFSFFLIPLLLIPWSELMLQYQSWLSVLREDEALKYGYSVAGWIHTWFIAYPNKTWITIIGIILFLIPYLRFKLYQDFHFRLLALSSILIWIVIFNHMAESPTYIIALAGASIWFFSKKPSTMDIILFCFVFAFASLSPTDIVPKPIRQEFFRPYVLKAVPCIILWCRIWYEMITMQEDSLKFSMSKNGDL